MKYSLKPGIVQKKIENELFIFDRDKGTICGFSETGALIWEGLTEGKTPEAITERIINDYEVLLETAQRDFNEFMQHIISRGLVSID
jgi:hypothetical protein